MKKSFLALALAALCIIATINPSYAWDSTVTGEIVGVATNPWDNRMKIIVNVSGNVIHFKLAADNADTNKLIAMALSGMAISHTATIFYASATKNIEDMQIIKQ